MGLAANTARGALLCVLGSVIGVYACSDNDPLELGDGPLPDANVPAEDGGDAGAVPDVVSADAPDVHVDLCTVSETNDSVPDCTEKSPPKSFDPVLKWEWKFPVPDSGPYAGLGGSLVTPLVGNFTDDNGDQRIDLCDTPDILVHGYPEAKLYLLAGDTGELETTFNGVLHTMMTPAIGDIDNDGLLEVVASDADSHLVAYEHDGTIKWTGPLGAWHSSNFANCGAIALHDLDGDGNVEIIAPFEVYDKNGKRLFGVEGNNDQYDQGEFWCTTPTAADLDGDGKLEVLFGNVTMRADGTVYWKLDGPPGQPHVANLDSDPEPEVFIAREDGYLVLEHDGKVKFGPVRPTQDIVSANCLGKPGSIHDFDGDGIADIAAGSCEDYSVFKVKPDGLSILWKANVADTSGFAGGTAFDFLGRGFANAIYGDESHIYVFDGETGAHDMKVERISATMIEYPVVADVDNDGSADLVVVGNIVDPYVRVYEDREKRWMPARRIWNQHAYYVNNVLEDGRIPKKVKPHWQNLNTFRANAQRSIDGECKPPPPKPPN